MYLMPDHRIVDTVITLLTGEAMNYVLVSLTFWRELLP